MPNYQAITRTDFAALRWQRQPNYLFCAHDALAPLTLQELPKACLSLPLAFIPQGETFAPAAVLGLQAGQNLWLTPDGRWRGPYVPAIYRAYPFALAQTEEQRLVLCIDRDSGLLGPEHPEAFFDPQGQPTPTLHNTLSFLEQVHADRQRTERVCALLQALELIQPWQITLQQGAQSQALSGLYRIDAERLHALDAAALQRLHQAGALALAYYQLLSMQHLQTLGQLSQAQVQAPDAGELGSGAGGDTLKLDFLLH